MANEEPMNLVSDRPQKVPDQSAEVAEVAADKELEKIALAAGGPGLDGKYQKDK